MTPALVILAGGCGALARFLLDSAFKFRYAHPFPWATVIINVTGSLLIGVLAGMVLLDDRAAGFQMIVGTGFCGGYTTFSTASFETVRLIEQNRLALAATNALGTVLLTALACAAGMALPHLV